MWGKQGNAWSFVVVKDLTWSLVLLNLLPKVQYWIALIFNRRFQEHTGIWTASSVFDQYSFRGRLNLKSIFWIYFSHPQLSISVQPLLQFMAQKLVPRCYRLPFDLWRDFPHCTPWRVFEKAPHAPGQATMSVLYTHNLYIQWFTGGFLGSIALH